MYITSGDYVMLNSTDGEIVVIAVGETAAVRTERARRVARLLNEDDGRDDTTLCGRTVFETKTRGVDPFMPAAMSAEDDCS